jgi:putative hydroxymethylpyrimidine transport system substrate-binding protein
MMKLLVQALAGSVLILAAAGCGTPATSSSGTRIQHASLVLDWYPNSDHAGLYTAMARGYLKRRGVALGKPHVPSDSTAQIALVAEGTADFGITYEPDLLAARAHHIPVQAVMCLVQHPLDTIMSLKRSHITRPRDLAGKRIGMAGTPGDRAMVAAVMRHDGVDPSRATMVNVGYNLLPALLSGRVDAVVGVYWTWEAIQARMKGYPVNVLRVERWGVPNYCELTLIAADRTIRTRPSLVRATVQGLQEGYAYAEAHPQAGWRALHAADKTLNQSLILQSIRLLRSAVVTGPTIGYLNPAQWQRYAGWQHVHGLVGAVVDGRAAMTDRFLARHVR